MEIARYIIDNNTTVRQAAKHFGISKSTVHKISDRDNIREKMVVLCKYNMPVFIIKNRTNNVLRTSWRANDLV